MIKDAISTELRRMFGWEDTVLIVGPVWQHLVNYVTKFIAGPDDIVHWGSTNQIDIGGQSYRLIQLGRGNSESIIGIPYAQAIVIVDPHYRLDKAQLEAIRRIETVEQREDATASMLAAMSPRKIHGTVNSNVWIDESNAVQRRWVKLP